jgi:hypothetical protein
MPAPATPLAQTSKRRVALKKESTFATAAGASGAQVLRRTQIALKLAKAKVESGEKRDDFQRADVRHGSRSIDGNLDCEMIPGVWEDFWAALVRRDFSSVSAITFSSGDGVTVASGVVTRAAGASQSFITDGVRAGMVGRFANLSATGSNARNLLVTAVTATTMTLAVMDGGAALADVGVADEACTFTIVGQVSFVPSTGHTSDSFSIEDYNADTDISKLYVGCRVVGASIRMEPNKTVTISWKIMGINREIYETSAAPYFTSPAAAGVDNVLEAAIGYIRLNGAQQAVVTGLSIDIDLGATNTPVNGANVAPDIAYGKDIKVSGQVTAFVTSSAFQVAYDAETEMELFVAFNAPGNAPRNFFGIFLPRIKLFSADEDDPDNLISQTLAFEALKKTIATGYESTTLMVQDSTLS